MKENNIEKDTPCVICGACCRYFKIEFDYKKNKQVPMNFYNKKTLLWQFMNLEYRNIAAMKGAESFNKGKCIALDGELGEKALCTIYENRPDHCRAFPVWEKNGEQNKRCIKARVEKGLKGEITEEELERARQFKIDNNIN